MNPGSPRLPGALAPTCRPQPPSRLATPDVTWDQFQQLGEYGILLGLRGRRLSLGPRHGCTGALTAAPRGRWGRRGGWGRCGPALRPTKPRLEEQEPEQEAQGTAARGRHGPAAPRLSQWQVDRSTLARERRKQRLLALGAKCETSRPQDPPPSPHHPLSALSPIEPRPGWRGQGASEELALDRDLPVPRTPPDVPASSGAVPGLELLRTGGLGIPTGDCILYSSFWFFSSGFHLPDRDFGVEDHTD